MSNLLLHIRFGARHLQIVRLGDWLWMIRDGRSPITLRRNAYQDERRKLDPEWRWFEWY